MATKKYLRKTFSILLATVLFATAICTQLYAVAPEQENLKSVAVEVYDSDTPSVQVGDLKIIDKEPPASKALEYLAQSELDVTDEEALKPFLQLDASLFGLFLLFSNASAYKNSSNPISTVTNFINYYGKGIKDLSLKLIDVDSITSEVAAAFTNNNGERQTVYLGIYYDRSTQLFYGRDNAGLFAMGYDYDVGQNTVYTASKVWQRNFGFCALYDYLSPLANMDYLTVRIKFSYGAYDWMIQLWKGRYTIAMGSEIGLYFKPPHRLIEFYDCATDDMLVPITMSLYNGDELLFSRGPVDHWWLCGFPLGDTCAPEALIVRTAMQFPSAEMRDAVVKAAKAQNTDRLFDTTYEGNTVYFAWYGK